MHITTPISAASILTCLVLVAGCGGGGGNAPGATPAAQAGGSVEDQLGFTRRGIAAAQAKVENAVAACMKSQGFEYVPVDPAAAQAALTGRPNLSDEEFERQFGYGISTLYGRGSPQSDPNYAYRQSLGVADRRAYDQALSGGQPEQTFYLAVDTGDFSQLGGCTKQATDALFGGTELLTTLQRKLDELDDAILADQRMVRAGEAWTRCMRAATGGTYEDSEAVEDEIRKQFEAIVGTPLPPGQVAPEGSYDTAALAELQRREVELSDHDVQCEHEHITPVETVVRAEKEAAFRERNAELLRRVKPLGS
jgi:hypothetical protein